MTIITRNLLRGSRLSLATSVKLACVQCRHLATGIMPIIFRQLFESVSCTYTYLLACPSTRKAILIDPVIETVERDLRQLHDLNLTLLYAANTHVHADHVTGSGEIKRKLPGVKSVLSEASGGLADVKVKHLDKLHIGSITLEIRATPGHTDGCITYVDHAHKMAFTGDALLIRGCGRTDFQQGNPRLLYKSVHEQILSLPDDFHLYPAHDYKGLMVTTVDEEKRLNPRLTKSIEEFANIMDNLGLAYPKQIDKSVPANKVCGVFDLMDDVTKSAILKTYEPKE